MIIRIEDATQDLKRVYSLLAGDVEAARAYGQADPSPFAHRTLFRTYFALIEGLSYQFRKVALACGERDPRLLSAQEIALLKEEKYSLNKEGEPEATTNFQKVLPNVLFSMHCYAKAHGASFQPDTSNHGWGAMQTFVTLRNGLEHPKSAADLELDESQIRSAAEAAAWWKQTVLQLLEICREADEYWKSKLA
jgi:hypothetical protein